LSYVEFNLWNVPQAVAYAQRALDDAEAVDDRALIAETLCLRVLMEFLSGNGVDWDSVERSLALDDPNRLVPLLTRPSALAALLTLYVGRLSEARERFQALRAAAVARGDESDLAPFLAWFVWLETRAGNFPEAEALAEEARLLAALSDDGPARAWVLAHRALLRAHVGSIEQARSDSAEATAIVERTGLVTPLGWIGAAQTLIGLSLDDPAAAWAAVEPLVEATETQGVGREPQGVPFLPDALEALILLGELDRAEALLDAFGQRARVLDRTWALATGGRGRGLLLAARSDILGAEAAFEAALEQHARLEMPFEQARTQLAYGRVLRRANKRKAARATLEQALVTFTSIGTPIWADKARIELGRIGVRRAPEELTPSEQAIAELAGNGLTNREIAARVFVSDRTVEATLARAYRKLGIRSRAQLGSVLAEPRRGSEQSPGGQ
jgi:DNA-binding CsgD family transcriptional regulator